MKQTPPLEKLSEENLRLTRRLKELEQQVLRQQACQRDTKSEFELPSEYRQRWEECMRDRVVDAFGEVLNREPRVVAEVIGRA